VGYGYAAGLRKVDPVMPQYFSQTDMKDNDSFGIDTSKFEQLCYYQFQLKMHSPYMRVYTTQWCVASFSKARSEFLLNASNVNTHPRDEI
jgi:hypothetical protein